MIFIGCEETLELEPRGEALTEGELLTDPDAYEGLIAKVYAGLALGGQEGGDGNADISGIDGGFSNYLRLYWKHTELSTDEALIAWNDGTIKDFQRHQWDDGNEFIRAMYSRINYQIALANDFIRNTSEESLDGFGIDESDRPEIREFRTEARFLRAYSYYHGMDLFGSMPFQDETTDPRTPGELITRAELFNYVESELLDIEDDIAPARMNEYGRADQATVWMTLAKIYLNSEIYTGTERNSDVIDYTSRVINAGYNINTDQPYGQLFFADNDSNGAQNSFIWTINFDGQRTQTFGGTTFLTHAPVGGDMDPAEFGINGGWFGIRTTPQFVELFQNEENSADGRELFFTENQSKAVNDEGRFNDGFAIGKYRNIDINGNQGSDATGDFVDIDFPVYRLADAYLMYAEANLRGGGGSQALAVDYINELRERAFGDDDDNISAGDLSLDFILDERGRELYWETHRRQDLIRFNQFSVNKTWAWKGNVQTGTTTPQFRDLFPIPAEQLNLNDNLVQNPGY
jgi:hypothetical protein